MTLTGLMPHTTLVLPTLTSADPSAVEIDPKTQKYLTLSSY